MIRVATRQSLFSTPSRPFYDVDARRFFTAALRAGYLVTNDQRAAHDKFVKALKANNLWSKIYAFYPFMGNTAIPGSAAINAKNPGTYNITWQTTNVLAYGPGVQGNGFNQLGVIPFATSNFVSLTSATIGCYVARKDCGTVNPEADIGCADATNTWTLRCNSGTTGPATNSQVQCGPAGVVANKAWGSYDAMPFTLYSNVRRASACELYVGGTLEASVSASITAIPNVSSIGVLATFRSTTPITPVQPTRRLNMFAYIAQELSAGELSTLTTLVEEYVWSKNTHYCRLKSTDTISLSLTHTNSISFKEASQPIVTLASGPQSYGAILDEYLDILPWMGSNAIFDFSAANTLSDLSAAMTNLVSITNKYYLDGHVDLSFNNLSEINFSQSGLNVMKTLDLRGNAELATVILPDNNFYYTSGEFDVPEPVSVFVDGTALVALTDEGSANYQRHFNQAAYGADYSEMFIWGYNQYTYYRVYAGEDFANFYGTESTATETNWTYMAQAQRINAQTASFVGGSGAADFPFAVPGSLQIILDRLFSGLDGSGLLSKAVLFNPVLPWQLVTPMLDFSGFSSAVNLGLTFNDPLGFEADNVSAIRFANGIDTYPISATNFCFVMCLLDNNGSAFPGTTQGYMGATDAAGTTRAALYSDSITSTTYRPRVRVGNQDNTPVASRAWNANSERIIILNSNSSTTLDRSTYNNVAQETFRDSFISGTQTGTLGTGNLFFLAVNNGIDVPSNIMDFGILGAHGVFTGLTVSEQLILAGSLNEYNVALGRF